jgi:hypothetical protein
MRLVNVVALYQLTRIAEDAGGRQRASRAQRTLAEASYMAGDDVRKITARAIEARRYIRAIARGTQEE